MLRKVQAYLDSIESVVFEACNIRNCVKEVLQKVMSLMRRLSNAKEAEASKLKSSFALMLLNSARSHSADVAVQV